MISLSASSREEAALTQGSGRPLCYRHRPDLVYQRLADKASMQVLQQVRSLFFRTYVHMWLVMLISQLYKETREPPSASPTNYKLHLDLLLERSGNGTISYVGWHISAMLRLAIIIRIDLRQGAYPHRLLCLPAK